MSDPDAKTIVRRWATAWNQGDVEAAVALLSPAYVRHDANLPEVAGPEAEKQFMQGVLAAFAGLEIAAQAILADGDLVAVRLVISGRHVGEFLGVAQRTSRCGSSPTSSFVWKEASSPSSGWSWTWRACSSS